MRLTGLIQTGRGREDMTFSEDPESFDYTGLALMEEIKKRKAEEQKRREEQQELMKKQQQRE